MDRPAASRPGVYAPLRRSLTRVPLALLLCLLAVAAVVVTPAAAQESGAVVVQPLEIEEDGSGDLIVSFVGEAAIDSFELTVQFDPALVRVLAVEPAEGWDPVQRGIRVERGGQVYAAGFSLQSPCQGSGGRCDLLRITMGAQGPGSADVKVMNAALFAGGDPLQEPDLVPGRLSVGGAVPQAVQGDGGDSDGTSLVAVSLWLIIVASGLVLVSVGIVSGSRWLWRRSGERSLPEPISAAPPETAASMLGDFESYLEHIERIGEVYGETGPAARPGEPGHEQST